MMLFPLIVAFSLVLYLGLPWWVGPVAWLAWIIDTILTLEALHKLFKPDQGYD